MSSEAPVDQQDLHPAESGSILLSSLRGVDSSQNGMIWYNIVKLPTQHIMGKIIIIIIIISTTMFMVLSSWQSHCESSPGSFDECRMAPSGRQPKTKPDNLGCQATGCQELHPPSPFIITQPES